MMVRALVVTVSLGALCVLAVVMIVIYGAVLAFGGDDSTSLDDEESSEW